MKLRYILSALVAVCALAIGCTQIEEPMALNELQLSQTYITIPAQGGSASVTFTASDSWTMDIPTTINGDKYLDDEKGVVTPKIEVSALDTDANNWVTISPRSGSAGQTTVTFSAIQASGSHTSNIDIKIGDKVQHIIVSQIAGKVDVPVISVKEAMNSEGSTVRIQGTCTSIANTSYGNWYLKDENGDTMYIYGTVDASGSYNWSSFNIAVGDVVTVQGPCSLYNGTYELVDASFISIKKALILSDDSAKTIAKGTDPFKINLTNNGDALTYDCQTDWLTVNGFSANGSKVTFTVTPQSNETGATRKGTIVFKSTKGNDVTEFPVTISQLASEPVEGSIVNIVEAAAAGTSKAPQSFDVILKDAVVTYVNGSNIFIEDTAASGIATNKLRGLLIYDGNCKLAVGDHVSGRVYGQGYNYNNLPEASSFNYELAKVTKGEEPIPTVIALDELNNNYENYLSRYITVSGTLSQAVNIVYSKVVTNGKITDGTNEIALYAQSSGKFNGNKIYFYSQAEEGKKVEFTTLPGIYKTTKQLNFYYAKQLVIK